MDADGKYWGKKITLMKTIADSSLVMNNLDISTSLKFLVVFHSDDFQFTGIWTSMVIIAYPHTDLRERSSGKGRVVAYLIPCVLTHLTLSLNSHCHAVAIFLARVEGARFRMRVTLGVILIRSLVYTTHIPGRLRSGSGVALEWWVHEEVIKPC